MIEVNTIRFFMAFLLRGMAMTRADDKDERRSNRWHLRTWPDAPEQACIARLSGVFFRECQRSRRTARRGPLGERRPGSRVARLHRAVKTQAITLRNCCSRQ